MFSLDMEGEGLIAFLSLYEGKWQVLLLLGSTSEAQADVLFDEILDIANTPIEGTKTKLDKDGEVVEISKGDMIEHRRLQIDARKWMAGKLRPKVYGDKLDVDLTGALDFVVNAKPMTEEEWQKQHGANPA